MPKFELLSTQEMDKHRDSAAVALRSISREAIKEVAEWWKQWYLLAGHKRLGRLLISNIKKTTLPETSTNPIPPIRAHAVSTGVEFSFAEESLDTSAMFSVQTYGGEIRIVLNTSHPAYQYIKGVVVHSETRDQEVPSSSIENSDKGIQFLLSAWAEYECDQTEGVLLNRARDVRCDWGRVSRKQISSWKMEE